MQYCSLQHRILLLSPVTSTTGYCSCFSSIPSFFLELFLHWSPVAYWAHTNLGSASFSILSFCLFILFMEFSRKNTEVVCHSLLQWTAFCQVVMYKVWQCVNLLELLYQRLQTEQVVRDLSSWLQRLDVHSRCVDQVSFSWAWFPLRLVHNALLPGTSRSLLLCMSLSSSPFPKRTLVID